MAEKNEVWTVGKILKWTENYFTDKQIDSPRLDAEVLLASVLKKARIYLYVHFDEPLQADELATYREYIKKRVKHIPVAYILGEKEFMGLTFKVTPATLVPRPDTEILVQKAIDLLQAKVKNGEQLRFADIGTGSGAICLTVAHFVPEAIGDTVDISADAKAVAQENAQKLIAEQLILPQQVTFYEGDLLAPLAGNSYDAILSNPPYIPEADIAKLMPEVRTQEPITALTGGVDGLDFYRKLCDQAPAMLKSGGFMAFEVGINQAAAVAKLAQANSLIARTEVVKDYAGIDRVVVAWRK